MREGNAMTELTALLTKALLSTTFGVSREQRYSADELRDALARASGSVAETRKVLSAQPEVDDISVESVANHLRDRLSKYIDVGSESVGHSFPVLGHNIRVPLPQHVTTYEPGDPTGSQSPQPHLEDGTTYRPLKIKNLHLTDSIDTESLSARGRSVWVHSSRVGFLDSRVPCNSLPARVGQD